MKSNPKTSRSHPKGASRARGRWQILFGLTILLVLVILSLAQRPYAHHAYPRGYLKMDHKNVPPFLSISAWWKTPPGQAWLDATAMDFFNEGKESPQADARISSRHLLGTDDLGSDILASIMEASRTLLIGGTWAALITLLLGLTGGVLIGDRDRPVTTLSNFVLAVFVSFPPLILLLLFLIVWGFSPLTVMTAIGIVNSPRLVKLLAQKIKLIKNQEFVSALQEAGLPHYLILGKHILWNSCRRLILVQAVYALAGAITLEISLSFLGLGIKERASLGRMVGRSWESLRDGHAWQFFIPLVVIILVLLGLYFLGDGINRRFRWQDER